MGATSMFSLFKRAPRSAGLLLTLLALIVIAPNIQFGISWLVVELMFDLILLSGVYSVGPGRHRWPFLVLTIVTLGARWSELVLGFGGPYLTAEALTAIWLCYAISIVVAHLFQTRDVSLDTISGAVVTYLLAAVAFGTLFQIIEMKAPGSFAGLPDDMGHDRRDLSSTMLYFSLVCITTMGYGDIVPASNLTRPLAVIEGVFGQLYLAVMIARLVGLHLASDRDLSS